MEKAGIAPRIMIDFSHANSNKDYRRQAVVCHDVAGQIAAGDPRIIGVMIESNLVAGAQTLVPGTAAGLRAEHYGWVPRMGRDGAVAARTCSVVRSARG